MKILCENCSAKYSISSELLKKEITRFRCKKCQHVMTVTREASGRGPDPGIQAQNQALQDEFDAALAEQEGAFEDEKTSISTMASITAHAASASGRPIAANDQEQGLVLRSDVQAVENRLAAMAHEEASTKVFNIDALQTLRAERKSAQAQRQKQLKAKSPPKALPPAPPPAPVAAVDTCDGVEWFALLDDRQVGPLSLAEVQEKIFAKELDGQTYMWNEHLPEWEQLSEIPVLAQVHASREKALLPPSQQALPASRGPVSYAPAPTRERDELGDLVKKELQAIGTEEPARPSAAALLLGEPGSPEIELGTHGVPSTLYPMPVASPVFAGEKALFTGDTDKTQSRLTWYVGVLGGVVLLLLIGGGVGGYVLLEGVRQSRVVSSQRPTIPVPRVIQPPRARPIVVAAPRTKRATPTPGRSIVPLQIRPLPLRKARPKRRMSKRRTMRKRRKTRRYRRPKRLRPRPRPRRAPKVKDLSTFLPPPPPPEEPAKRKAKTKNGLNEKELQRLLGNPSAR